MNKIISVVEETTSNCESPHSVYFTGYPELVWGHKVLTRKEEEDLVAMIKKNPKNLEARQRLMLCNLKLVAKFAKEYVHESSLTYEDLIQEGIIGLNIAIDKFKLQGNKFATYATYWILLKIKRAITDTSKLVRTPENARALMRIIHEKHLKFLENEGRPPTLGELSAILGRKSKSLAYIAELLGMPEKSHVGTSVSREIVLQAAGLQKSYSLDSPVDPGQDQSPVLGDFLADFNDVTTKAAAEREEQKKLIGLIIEKTFVGEKELLTKRVLKMRFGLEDEIEHSLQEIGNHFNLSRERVRQIEEKGLMKLGRSLSRHPDFLERAEYSKRMALKTGW